MAADQQEQARIGEKGGIGPEILDMLPAGDRDRSARAEVADDQPRRQRREHTRGMDMLGKQERSPGDDGGQRHLDQMVRRPAGD
ncbi:hypothetical protein LTR94_037590, partial [Friedmanniomyces endolithicus]